jgi:hypothetical protein
LQQPQVVPRRGVGRIDRDDTPVGVDRVFPLCRIAVPLAGALEPGFGLIGGRCQRTHHAGAERGGGGSLEPARVEGQHHLARARIEANAIGLGDEPVTFEHQPYLGQRLLEVRILTTQGRECLADLPHRGSGVEERAGRAKRQQVAERVTGVAAQKLQTDLTANPDIKGVYMESSFALSGTLQVLKQKGLAPSAAGRGRRR